MDEQRANDDTTPHTPGPWGYVYDGSSTWSVGQVADPQDMPPYACIMDRNDRRAQANARLIASAPELLMLAKRYARTCQECGGKGTVTMYPSMSDRACEACADVRAVIDKADGRAQMERLRHNLKTASPIESYGLGEITTKDVAYLTGESDEKPYSPSSDHERR